MHQHVEAELFLQLDDALDLVLHELLVLLVGQVALVVAGAGRADLGGLREGADGGRGQRRQVQRCSWAASRTAYSERLKSAGGQGGGAGADVGAADALGFGAGGDDAGGLVDGRLDGGGVGQQTGEGDDLNGLLVGESQPAAQLLGELDSSSTSCGTCWVEVEVLMASLATTFCSSAILLAEACRSLRQMLWPSMTPATRVLVPSAASAAADGNLALEDVDVQGVDVGGGEGAELAVQCAVRGGHEQLRAVGGSGEDLVGSGQRRPGSPAQGCPGPQPGRARRAGPSWRRRRRASRAARRRPAGGPRGGTAG